MNFLTMSSLSVPLNLSILTRMKTLILVLITLSGFTAFGWEQSFHFPQGTVTLQEVSSSVGSPAVRLSFELKPEWHIYWKNSGDSGAAPKWAWTVDNGRVEQEHWPLPERIPVEGLINFGYSREAQFLFGLSRQKEQAPTTAQVALEFLICKVECIPYFTTLGLTIPPQQNNQLPRTEVLYPRDAPNSWTWEIEGRDAQNLRTRLQLKSPAIKSLEIFPEDGESFKSNAPAVEPSKGGYNVLIPLQDTGKTDFSGSRFLLVIEEQNGQRLGYYMSLGKKAGPSLALILLWALIGGFILNFMPCVFPVLSIKALSFLNPGSDARKLRLSGWFYTFGVLGSFLGLGALLLLLRAGGEQIGWGFQLQSPVVTASIALLFFWLSLNFLGTFEIGQSLTYLGATKTKASLGGSFMTGVLATVVATPCTAPFMGAALGASLTLPAAGTMAVFAGLGVGMALPFLMLSYFPKILNILPKPGAWMQTFKEFLAFPLLATVIWLVWVLSNQVSADALIFVFGLFLTVCYWIWLGRQVRDERWRQLLLLAGFIFSFTALSLMPTTKPLAETPQQSRWLKYDETAIQKNLADGRAVFIDFTAAWCITCQVNKKVVLNTSDIQDLFAKNDVQLYKADWTDKDPAITAALARYGRNSLPLYVFYEAGSQEPRLLPEILTQSLIEQLFNKEK